MKRAALFLAAYCLLLFAVPSVTPPAWGESLADVDAAVDRMFRQSKAVGGSLVVIKDGRLVYARDYGMRNVNAGLPVDENTYFKVFSVTKMVSAIAILQLAQDGLLDLDVDISRYFGYRIANPYYLKTPLTLRQLMSHTSSLSEDGGFSRLSSTVYEMLSRKARRDGNYQKAKPGDSYVYSNFGAGLAGAVVEATAGLSFNRLLRERVFQPLGIDASLAASWLSSPGDVASLYADGQLFRSANKYLDEAYEDTASPETHYRTTVGSLFIRPRDLARLAAALCGDGSVDGVELLREDTLHQMRAGQDTLGGSVTGESPYGLFLERNTRLLPGRTVYGHQGMSEGAASDVYFEPETGFVFVMATNGCSMVRDHGTIVLAQNLLRYTYPLFSGGADGRQASP